MSKISTKKKPPVGSCPCLPLRSEQYTWLTLPFVSSGQWVRVWDAADISATMALNRRLLSKQSEPVRRSPSLTNVPVKTEALPLCTDPQPSSDLHWQLWCSIQLMTLCQRSLFTGTWAGWHGSVSLLSYQNKCVTLFREDRIRVKWGSVLETSENRAGPSVSRMRVR